MSKLNVLVVDDETAFRATLLRRLSRRGVNARGAENGRQALEMLRGWQAQVVVLDVKMPGMDGLEVLGRIKAGHPGVEVVLLTGHADREAARAAMAGGAFDYMLKPIAIEELLWAVEEAGRHAATSGAPADDGRMNDDHDHDGQRENELGNPRPKT